MDIRKLLEAYKAEDISLEEAVIEIKKAPFTDIGFAKIDNHRYIRQGAGEVIYGQGKSPEQIIEISNKMLEEGQERVLITRLSKEKYEEVKKEINITYYEKSAIGVLGSFKEVDKNGKIAVLTGGTSDIPVAEEAVLTARFFGNEVLEIYDVGVAGIHRLFANLDEILSARVIIVIAGMEGALASVVGGLVDVPVIAVPTSVGYGASFGGVTALFSMINSCASGVSVVNIDNGFGAGYLASMINKIGN